MIGVYIGERGTVERVAREFRAHAASLRRPLDQLEHVTPDGIAVYAAWDPTAADDANRLFIACPAEGPCRYADPLGDAAARIRVHVTPSDVTLEVDVPIGAPVPALHAELDGGRLFTDDLRVMRRLIGRDLDDRAVYGLLKWGAAPAPFTIVAGVTRVMPGTTLTYDGRTRAERTQDRWRETVASLPELKGPTTADEARGVLVSAIDRAIAAVPAGSAVLFSAGADSPLLAARLAATGARDTQLVHMSFSDAPAETVAAREIAHHLGLRLHEVPFDAAHATEVLRCAGREWPDPVGDTSVVVAHRVAEAAFGLGAHGLVDGTAGGTADNRRRTSMRFSRVPTPGSRLAAAIYSRSGVWRRESGRLERVLRLAAGANVPLPAGALLQNSLDGIAYAVPNSVGRELAAAIARPVEAFPDGPLSRDAFAVAALVQQGAGRWAAKTLGPASSAGVPAVIPFLAADVCVAKLLTMDGPWAGEASKPLFRMELERHLPRHLVYRKKHAFMAPMRKVMAVAGVREAVAASIESGRPLADYVRPKIVHRLLADARGGRPIGSKQAGLLWTLAFTDRWLRDVDTAAADR